MAMREEIIKTSIEALQQSHVRLLQEEENRVIHTKGKLRQTQQDVEKEAETERKLAQIAIALSELRETLTDAKLSEEPGVAGLPSPARLCSSSLSNPGPALTGSTSDCLDDEPIFNLFTGSYAHRETGFEPGPSRLRQDQRERYETPRSFSSGKDVGDDEPGQPEASFDSATTQSSIYRPAGHDALETQHPQDNATQRIKTSLAGTHQSGRRRLGYLGSFFNSWVSPSLRGFFFGRSTSTKSGLDPVSHGGQDAQPGLSNGSTTNSASTSSTTFGRSNFSADSLMSTSTTPSSLFSVNSKRYSTSKKSPEPVYRPAFSSIEETDKTEQRDTLQKPDSSVVSDTPRKTTVPSYDQKQQESIKETSTDLPPDHPGRHQRSQDWALALSLEEQDLADRNQVALSHRLAAELQLQEDKEAAFRQRELDIERDRAEAMRLQEEFDQEGDRQRLATLQYVEGLDEAVRLHEEERTLQVQEQAAADLFEANRLAEIDQAARLHHEQIIQYDREYARAVQAELYRGPDSQHPVGLQSDELLLLDRSTIHNAPVKSSTTAGFPSSAKSQRTTPRTSTPIPFQRFPSFHDVQRPTTSVVDQEVPIARGSSMAQDTGAQAFKDRALALKLHEAEKTKMAHEDTQWQKDLSALQRASKTWNAGDSAQDKAASQRIKPQRALQTRKADVQVHARSTQGPTRPIQPPSSHPAPVTSSTEVADCGICGDSIPKTQLVRPCEHFYCRDCLADWFQRALREKPKKQPRCCKRDIPVNLVAQQLGPAFLTRYEMFELEIATPNPLYCASRKCSAFVPPSSIHGDLGLCRCGVRTCRHCRSREHPGTLCAQDQETQKVEAMGKQQGWKHCPRCKHLIERTAGCLHMTCSQCRTEFCWKCLKKSCKGEGACR